MHDHGNNDNKGMGSMAWMIVAVLLVLIFLFDAGGKAVGFPLWIVFGGIAAMIIAHIFMMRKSHKQGDSEHQIQPDNKNKDDKKDNNHGRHGCCH